MLAAEHLLDFGGLHLYGKVIQRPIQVRVDILPLLRPFDEHREVVTPLSQRFDQREVILQPPPTLQDALRYGLILPEIRGGRLSFDLGELVGRSCRVKDSSAGPPRA